MSEYQYIEFRAVDRPLTDKELAYAEKQSSRAEISRRKFTNEYNYSSFRGNVDGLLRRGYDIFLEYSNYGNRTIKFRLPFGLPFDRRLTKQFLDKHLLRWDSDSKGKGGILTMQPYLEMPDQVWEFDNYLEQAIALRNLLVTGDIRALYLCWLFVAADENYGWEEAIEPPVPVGLEQIENEFAELFLFFDLDPMVVRAAAESSATGTKANKALPNIANLPTLKDRVSTWTKSLSATDARNIVSRFLAEDETSVKAELLAKLPGSDGTVSWPTVKRNRSFKELVEASDELRKEQNVKDKKKAATKAKREAAKQQKKREERMAEMIQDPQKWLKESESLVEARGTQNYERAAEILSDMQQALENTKSGAQIVRTHAAHLTTKYPTLNRLKGSLRKHGVLD
jgi:hypothetical protein